MVQASGKFDLKEPYYRQLNPQTSATWPQQEQTPEQSGQLSHQQQSYVQQMQNEPVQMQQAGWSAQQQGVAQYAMMSQPCETDEWNQPGYQHQMWR